MFCFLSNRYGISQSTLLQGPTSSLAHRSMSTPLRGLASLLAHRPESGSNNICNSSSPPLAYIVLFRLSFQGFPHGFKTHVLGRGLHTLIKMFCSSLQLMCDLTNALLIALFFKPYVIEANIKLLTFYLHVFR